MTLSRGILDFWFGAPDSPDFGRPRDIWFQADEGFDLDVARRFEKELRRAAAGDYDGMVADADGALALTILLDQFPRNIYRGTAQAFAFDSKALAVARQSLSAGQDRVLAPFQRPFLYLPFEHSESLEDQDRAVALFQALGDEKGLDFAIRHRDVIARFGRFPHRNALLGRESTDEEIEFLKQPDSSFGGQTPPSVSR